MSENPQEQSEAKLLAYIEGELDEASRAEIERYLAGNPKHRRLLAELTAGREQLRRLPRESAPPELFDGFQAQLERQLLLQPAADINPQTGNFRLNRWGQIRAAAAAVVLASGLGVIVYTAMPKGPQGRGPVALQSTPGTSNSALPTAAVAIADPNNQRREGNSGVDKSDRLRGQAGGAASAITDRRADELRSKARNVVTPASPEAVALAFATPQERAAVDFARALPGVRAALSVEPEVESVRKSANGVPVVPLQLPPAPAPTTPYMRDGATTPLTGRRDSSEANPADKPEASSARTLAAGEPRTSVEATGGSAAAGGARRSPTAPKPSAVVAAQSAGKPNVEAADAGDAAPAMPSAVPASNAEPVYVVVASVNAAADSSLALALADVGLTERSRVVYGSAEAARHGDQLSAHQGGMLPKAAAESQTSGTGAALLPQTLPSQATVPPAITPLPVPMAIQQAGTVPAMPMAASTHPKEVVATGAQVPAASPAASQPADGNTMVEKFAGAGVSDVRQVTVLRRVSRAQANALIARLHRPDGEQVASAYLVEPTRADLTPRDPGNAMANVDAASTADAAGNLSSNTDLTATGAATRFALARGLPPAAPGASAGMIGESTADPLTKQATAPRGSANTRLAVGAAATQSADTPSAAMSTAAAPAPFPATESTRPAAVPTELAGVDRTTSRVAIGPRTKTTGPAESAEAIRPGDAIVVHYTHIRAALGSVPPPVTVKPDGTILIAGHGSFRIAGMTPEQATELLNADFRRQQQNRSVEIRRVPPADAIASNPSGPRPTKVFGSSFEFGKFIEPTTQPDLIDVVIVVRQPQVKPKL